MSVRDDADQAALRGASGVLARREAGIALKAQACCFVPPPQRDVGNRTDPPQHSFREIRRPQIPRGRARQGRALAAALVENPRDRVAGFRMLQLMPGIGPSGGAGARQLAATPDVRWPCAIAPPRPPRLLDRISGLVESLHQPLPWPADFERSGLVRGRARTASTRTPPVGPTYPARADRERLSVARSAFLTELTLDPPDATSDEAGRAPARRGLSDSVHHPLREGPGMDSGLFAQRGRRRCLPTSRRKTEESRKNGGCSTSR